MPPGDGRICTVAKVANFSETAKQRRWNGVGSALVRFNAIFFDKAAGAKRTAVKIIYVFLYDGGPIVRQNCNFGGNKIL